MSIVAPASAFAGARRLSPSCLPDVLPPGARAIRDAAVGRCRWPLGEVADPAFHFCDCPRVRGSYCDAHAALSRKGRVR